MYKSLKMQQFVFHTHRASSTACIPYFVSENYKKSPENYIKLSVASLSPAGITPRGLPTLCPHPHCRIRTGIPEKSDPFSSSLVAAVRPDDEEKFCENLKN